jgi:hypothetical protein
MVLVMIAHDISITFLSHDGLASQQAVGARHSTTTLVFLLLVVVVMVLVMIAHDVSITFRSHDGLIASQLVVGARHSIYY